MTVEKKEENKSNENNLQKKKNIAMDRRDHCLTYDQLQNKYNVSRSFVRTAIKLSGELINVEYNDSLLLKHNKPNKSVNKYIQIDEYILNSMSIIRAKGGNINRSTIKSMAEKFIRENNVIGINANDYFTRAFLKRHKVMYTTLHGEAKSATQSDFSSFCTEYKALVSQYKKEDIFNVDETALYIKNIGNKSYTLDKSDKKGIKVNKVRMTLAIMINCFNENMPMLFVGKSKNPRALKGENPLKDFNIMYFSNESSWVTKSIFSSYIEAINQILVKKERKILLVMDNFSGHIIPEPSNIKFIYLPPNSTSIIQPLDQGAIKVLKDKYKGLLNNYVNYLLIDKNCPLKNVFLE